MTNLEKLEAIREILEAYYGNTEEPAPHMQDALEKINYFAFLED